jgi:hypothetical protein
MFRTNVEDIKKHESAPQIVEIFSKKEIQKMSDFYDLLPLRVFNQAQNVKKKAWIQGIDMQLDRIYFDGLKRFLGDYKMDNLKSEDGKDLFGLYHESFNPLPLHVDSGFKPEDIIYKQALTPFTSGQTVIFKSKWYGRSSSFTIDSQELKFKPKADQNDRSNKHIVVDGKSFDKNIHQKYLSHINIENLRGMEIEMIYEWKVGETFIMDRTYIHCSSSNLEKRKLGLTTFTKK